MRINSVSNKNFIEKRKDVYFGSLPILRANMLKVTPDCFIKNIPVEVSKLLPEDLDKINSILPKWSNDTEFGADILINFITRAKYVLANKERINRPWDMDFYMVERLDEVAENEKVRALAAVKNSKKELFLDYIQSANEMSDSEKLRGAGELLLYSLVKGAKEKGQKIFSLISCVDDWYERLGWKYPDCEIGRKFFDSSCLPSFFPDLSMQSKKMVLESNQFDKFLKQVEMKYKIEK